jgi:hypothetical protein
MQILLIDDLGNTLLLSKEVSHDIIINDKGVQSYYHPNDCEHHTFEATDYEDHVCERCADFAHRLTPNAIEPESNEMPA